MTSPNIDVIIANTIGREGRYSNNPADPGGETMWGITVGVARANGYDGPMQELPQATATAIYKKVYWIAPGFGAMGQQSNAIAVKLFDMGVNCGQGFAVRTMIRCLNVLNNSGTLWADVPQVPALGITAQAALKSFLNQRGIGGENTLLFMLAAQQSNHYLELAEARASNEQFEYGWQSQRALYEAFNS